MIQAFADTFGYIVEFDNIVSINQKFGRKGLTLSNSNQ